MTRSLFSLQLPTRQISSISLSVVLLSVALLITGCKEGDLGPELAGGIDGLVLDYSTSEPVGGASITTSPPTDALVSDGRGRFSLRDVEAGNYTIHTRKPGYQPNTVTVRVRENMTAEATIFLEDGMDEVEADAAIDVVINEWWRTARGDSSFVQVEYLVTNSGTQDIGAYDVYFRIDAGAAEFYHRESGTELKRGQMHVGGFNKYTRSIEADSVRVESTWVD